MSYSNWTFFVFVRATERKKVDLCSPWSTFIHTVDKVITQKAKNCDKKSEKRDGKNRIRRRLTLGNDIIDLASGCQCEAEVSATFPLFPSFLLLPRCHTLNLVVASKNPSSCLRYFSLSLLYIGKWEPTDVRVKTRES